MQSFKFVAKQVMTWEFDVPAMSDGEARAYVKRILAEERAGDSCDLMDLMRAGELVSNEIKGVTRTIDPPTGNGFDKEEPVGAETQTARQCFGPPATRTGSTQRSNTALNSPQPMSIPSNPLMSV
jgi:hypothetical protein